MTGMAYLVQGLNLIKEEGLQRITEEQIIEYIKDPSEAPPIVLQKTQLDEVQMLSFL